MTFSDRFIWRALVTLLDDTYSSNQLFLRLKPQNHKLAILPYSCNTYTGSSRFNMVSLSNRKPIAILADETLRGSWTKALVLTIFFWLNLQETWLSLTYHTTHLHIRKWRGWNIKTIPSSRCYHAKYGNSTSTSVGIEGNPKIGSAGALPPPRDEWHGWPQEPHSALLCRIWSF